MFPHAKARPAFATRCFAALLMLATAGCSRIEQARECREVAGIVNARVTAIRALSEQPRTPARLREIAKRYGELAASLGPIPVSDKQLALDLAEYAQALNRTATASSDAAEAIEKQNDRRLGSARRELGVATQSARLALRQVEQYCTGQRVLRFRD